MPGITIGKTIEIGSVAAGEFVNLVPIWFYSFSAIAYAIAAFISLLITYFSYKSYRSTEKKFYLALLVSFAIMTASFVVLTFTSVYTYFYYDYFRGFLSLNLVNNNGFTVYYVLSLVAYALLAILYLPKKWKKIFEASPLMFVPIWYSSSATFHIISILLLLFITLRTAKNYLKIKTANSFLVLFSFAMITLSHVLMLSLPFDTTYYLLAHGVLAVGFLSILTMLIRVNQGGKKKK